MQTYKYKGIAHDGKRLSGKISAYNETDAVNELRKTLSIITGLREVGEVKSKDVGKRKIKEKELAIICSQFEIILSSGLSIVRCVEMVAGQVGDKGLRNMLLKVAEDVASGYTMAQSFEKNSGGRLPATFIETIRAGEQSGTLESCFKRLHKYYDKTSKIKSKIASALTYPIMVIVVAVIVIVIIMAVAVPKFTQVFNDLGVELPFITRALISVSNFFVHFWWLIFLTLGAGLLALYFAGKTENGKKAIDGYKLTKSPLHGIHSMSASASFAETMSTMLASGMPIVRALEITSNVMANYAFGSAVKEVRDGVEQGRTISETMQKNSYFPKMLTEMTAVGESTGSMEETLDVIGEYFTNEVDLKTSRLLQIMEPAITAGLAVMTVLLLLAVYLPIFNLYGNI